MSKIAVDILENQIKIFEERQKVADVLKLPFYSYQIDCLRSLVREIKTADVLGEAGLLKEIKDLRAVIEQFGRCCINYPCSRAIHTNDECADHIIAELLKLNNGMGCEVELEHFK